MGLDESLKALTDGGKGRNSDGTGAQVLLARLFEGVPHSPAAALYEISQDHVKDLFRKPIHGCERGIGGAVWGPEGSWRESS